MKFAPSVTPLLREKVKSEDEKFLNAYLRKDKFTYPFREEDYVYCDFEKIPSNLGNQLTETFVDNLSSEKKNDYRTADFECAKLLYENLNLTPRQAADKDFWNYLHHHDMYQYLHSRWNEIENPSKGSQETYIFRHWIMSLSSQKHLINYPLTTLWWSIHLTIDNERQERYELSRIYFNNNRYRTVTFGGSSYVRHKEAILGILEFYQENNIPETKELGDKISKFINLLGGTKPLAFFTRDWFKFKLEERFPKLVNKEKIGKRTKIDNFSKKPTFIAKPNEKTNIGRTDLVYFSVFKEGKYFLRSSPMKDAAFNITIPTSYQNGYLLLCYENGRVNKIPLSQLLNKTIDQSIPYWGGLNKEANLIDIKCIDIECLLLITVDEPSQGKLGKIFRTSWLPEMEFLNSRGIKISLHTNKLNYSILPETLDKRLSRLISPGTSGFCPKNNTFYSREWTIIQNHFREQINRPNSTKQPEITFSSEFPIEKENTHIYFNIYETGLFFYSDQKPTEKLAFSLQLPQNRENKYLYLCYDNGQIAKLSLKNLPDLSIDVRSRNGKYPRAGLINLGVGEFDANILICRQMRSRGRCFKIHSGEWIPESKNLADRGTEVVNSYNRLSYAILPSVIDDKLVRLKERHTGKGILLDHPANHVQKTLLYKQIPDFFNN
ncbi:hypothetical protein APR40_11275 [Salegentibacter salarius]|uniref:Uncharacterized protein n=1 Tax=Salegentibacter salarius TaxID=435906 RepID=A0A2N0TX33_9FLAO|nr:hypothetical protein APR40_11275 [Salegentibacter salarius]